MFNRVVLVDQNNNEIGTEDKLDAHKKGLLHRAFSIFIFNARQIGIKLRLRVSKYQRSGCIDADSCD